MLALLKNNVLIPLSKCSTAMMKRPMNRTVFGVIDAGEPLMQEDIAALRQTRWSGCA